MLHPSHVRWGRAGVALLYLVATVTFVISIKPFYHRNTGFTSLIAFGDQLDAQMLPALRALPRFVLRNSPGYDSQFYVQVALDPLLRNRAIDTALDTPAYRARRILFAWTAYVFGLGQPAWIVNAYALQNVVAWFLLASLLLRWLPPTSARNATAWLGCVLSAGLLESVRAALLEGPSMLVLVLAIVAIEQKRPWIGGGLMGLAGLGRETNLLGSGLVFDRFPSTRREGGRTLSLVLLVVTPLVLWSLYLFSLYGTSESVGTDNLAVPFAAYIDKWTSVWRALLSEGWRAGEHRFSLVVLVSLTTQWVFLLLHRDWRNPWWRMGAGYCVLFPTLGAAVWAGHPGAAVRVLLPMTFAFNVLVPRSRWHWPLVFLGNVSLIYGLHRLEVPWLAQYL